MVLDTETGNQQWRKSPEQAALCANTAPENTTKTLHCFLHLYFIFEVKIFMASRSSDTQ